MKITIVVSIIALVLIGWLIWKFINAPEGYEDETGFHYGTKK